MPLIGEVLRTTRNTLNLSEREAACRLGISTGHLADIEHDRIGISLSRAARFARRLGLKRSYLVQAALQACVDEARLPFKVTLTHMPTPNPRVTQKIAAQTGKR